MAGFKWLKRGCRGCLCGGLRAAECLLALLAILQTAIILFTNLGSSIRIPDPLLVKLIQHMAGDAIQLTWERSQADLSGVISVEKLRVFLDRSELPILEADRIWMDLALDDKLLPGSDGCQQIRIHNLRLLIPPQYSPSGIREAIMRIPEAHLERNGRQITLRHAQVHTADHQLLLLGKLIDDRPARRKHPKAVDVAGLLQRVDWQRVLRLADIGRAAAVVEIYSVDGILDWRTRGLLDDFAVNGLQLDRLLLNANGTWLNRQNWSIQQLDAQAHMGFPPIPPMAVWAEPLRFYLPHDPVELRLSLGGLAVQDSALVVAEPLQLDLISDNPGPHLLPLPLHINLRVQPEGKDLPLLWQLSSNGLEANGSLPLSAIEWLRLLRWRPVQPFEWSQFPRLEAVRFAARVEGKLLDLFAHLLPQHRILEHAFVTNARITGTYSINDLAGEGLVWGDDGHIGQTLFQSVKARFTVTTYDLLIEDGNVIKNNTEFAHGGYYQHFKSARFYMRLTGSLLPGSLDGFLQEWWSRIFRDIQISSPVPADVAVWGSWKQAKAISSMTALTDQNPIYAGCRIPLLHLKIRNNSQWTFLEEMRGIFPEGTIYGQMAWQRVAATEWQPFWLQFEGHALWQNVRQLAQLGELDDLEFDGPTSFNASGRIWFAPAGAMQRTGFVPDLQFRVAHQGNARYRQVEFSSLLARGRISGDTLVISPINAFFADGFAALQLNIANWRAIADNPVAVDFSLIHTDAALTNVELRKLLPETALSSPSPVLATAGGRMDASGSLQWLNTGTPPSGSGSLQLQESSLGDVHLFGGLSRLLSDVGLGLASFQLNSAILNWSTRDATVRFDDSLIRGPVLVLELNGEYNYAIRELNIAVDATLFGGLFGKILAPISRNLSFLMTGDPARPDWRLQLHPFRWFQEQLQEAP